MPQELFGIIDGDLASHSLPSPSEQILPGVLWGNAAEVFSPAYWAHVHWLSSSQLQQFPAGRSKNLIEEIAFCLLGGYGITWEMNHAAFHRLRSFGMFDDFTKIRESSIESALKMPLKFGDREARYRFPNAKAKTLAVALRQAVSSDFDDRHALTLRSQLMELPGIGWKTASWIVRDWLGSDEVAILDIHVIRAGQLMGLFRFDESVTRGYQNMEGKFVSLAARMRVRTSELDILIWEEMRATNSLAISMLDERMKRKKAAFSQRNPRRKDIRAPS